MAEWCRGISKKHHQIAEALRVAYGGAMAAAIAWQSWQNRVNGGIAGFFFKTCATGVGLTRPNPTRVSPAKGNSERENKATNRTVPQSLAARSAAVSSA